MIDSIHSLSSFAKYDKIIVANEHLYLIEDGQRIANDKIPKSELQLLLDESDAIAIEDIERAAWNRKKAALTLYQKGKAKGVTYPMQTQATGKHLVQQLQLKREAYRRKSYMTPYLSILVMLGIFGFIWAGTRADVDDIDPEGIEMQLAYGVVYVLKYIVMLIGQLGTLLVGLLLTCWFCWIIYKQYFEIPDVVVWKR